MERMTSHLIIRWYRNIEERIAKKQRLLTQIQFCLPTTRKEARISKLYDKTGTAGRISFTTFLMIWRMASIQSEYII